MSSLAATFALISIIVGGYIIWLAHSSPKQEPVKPRLFAMPSEMQRGGKGSGNSSSNQDAGYIKLKKLLPHLRISWRRRQKKDEEESTGVIEAQERELEK